METVLIIISSFLIVLAPFFFFIYIYKEHFYLVPIDENLINVNKINNKIDMWAWVYLKEIVPIQEKFDYELICQTFHY